eukprot:3797458-Pyramimonas_sp.AAC.2
MLMIWTVRMRLAGANVQGGASPAAGIGERQSCVAGGAAVHAWHPDQHLRAPLQSHPPLLRRAHQQGHPPQGALILRPPASRCVDTKAAR